MTKLASGYAEWHRGDEPEEISYQEPEMVNRRRPMIGKEAHNLPALQQHPADQKGSIDRDILGPPQRVEIPWATLTASEVRALAKDMLEAWSTVEALTHREDLTPRQMLFRCKAALNVGMGRLPKRSGGRPQKRR
jgi:hypothetical protein